MLGFLLTLSIAMAGIGWTGAGDVPHSKIEHRQSKILADTTENLSTYIQEASAPKDSVLLDATWLLCEDSTESLLMMQDGATIYAVGNRGVAFRIGSTHLAQIQSTLAPISSYVDTAGLDSCNTIGLVLAGPRYLLLNRRGPTDATRDLSNELHSLRKYALRRLDRDIAKSIANVNREESSELVTNPTLHAKTLERGLYRSPIVRTWRCRSTVLVTAQVDSRGRVRRAFVVDAPSEGKCTPLVISTALRGVLLSTFSPGEKEEGKAGAGWVNVEVNVGRSGT